jgi:hypothetical protein
MSLNFLNFFAIGYFLAYLLGKRASHNSLVLQRRLNDWMKPISKCKRLFRTSLELFLLIVEYSRQFSHGPPVKIEIHILFDPISLFTILPACNGGSANLLSHSAETSRALAEMCGPNLQDIGKKLVIIFK